VVGVGVLGVIFGRTAISGVSSGNSCIERLTVALFISPVGVWLNAESLLALALCTEVIDISTIANTIPLPPVQVG